ncbi:uncharacterized protein [Fopius arisanus]|uniref:Uncharacterized protein n=1 Tax=Fopius arisanus TaxID=64838 RepID=A0A9R1TDW4_9HYME|nr:PREDICTED: uncharacterized protein LOC105269209 [Fopius arisanus]
MPKRDDCAGSLMTPGEIGLGKMALGLMASREQWMLAGDITGANDIHTETSGWGTLRHLFSKPQREEEIRMSHGMRASLTPTFNRPSHPLHVCLSYGGDEANPLLPPVVPLAL